MNYFLIGIAFYLFMSWWRRDFFKNAGAQDMLMGMVFGVLMWPIALCLVVYQLVTGKV